jgi:prepilin-type N-terminal cleavage/methylation domain-containing protein
MTKSNKLGFTLIELLVVVAIIGLLSTFSVAAYSQAMKKSRDSKRKGDIAQIARFFSLSCYLPEGGAGEYDLLELFNEAKIKNPQFFTFLERVPRDPLIGTDSRSYYTYKVGADGRQCALYSNLENNGEQVTLSEITSPTVGGGSGVLQSGTTGQNGTTKYFQFSN